MEGDSATRRAVPWVACLVAFGLGLRAFHYLREPSVWYDEAFLLVNVLRKTFLEQLGPLLHDEAAPPLFLWAERAISLVFGDGIYALRLLPFLASCAALLLLAWVARRLLPVAAVPWAVLLMACSDRLLWHGCEAKPYAVDVLCGVGMLALYVRLRDLPLPRQCLIFAAAAPVVIFLSFPGCFLYGGLLVALVFDLGRDRRPASIAGYALLALTVFGSFLLLLGPIHAQRCQGMDACWVNQFPHWDRPWTVPGWMVFSTLDVVRYCFQPTGHALGIVAGFGAFLLWRQGQRPLVVLLVLPLALALAASCIHAYPYGGARVEVYALPALALLTAAAVPALLDWLRPRSRLALVGLIGLLVAPLFLATYHAVDPWPRADSAGASAYVLAHRGPEDVVASNHEDYLYYFRNVQPPHQRLEELSVPSAERLWLILTGTTPAEERAMVAGLLPTWQPLEEKSFDWTRVYLLRRCLPSAVPSAPPRSRP